MTRVLITGANRGIGLELAKLFKAHGAHVWGVCREPSEEMRSACGKILDHVDVTRFSSLKEAVEQLPQEKIDILINNAGVLEEDSWESWNEEELLKQFKVNSIGPLNVTRAFESRLGEGSKVAMITSRMGSIADNTSGGYYGYRASKAALNAFGKSLALDLKPKGIAVALIHPGYVKTRMTGFQGQIDASSAAEGIYAQIEKLNLENTGSFWHSNGENLPW